MRTWVEASFGSPVVAATTQIGGMSPGCAARLRTAAGTTAFVKAVGTDLNPGTVELFRREIMVLGALPSVPYRASLRGSYDDGGWVALLLDDVEGRHPDLHHADEAAAVWRSVLAQVQELTPPPFTGVTTLAHTAGRYLDTWRTQISVDTATTCPRGRFTASTSCSSGSVGCPVGCRSSRCAIGTCAMTTCSSGPTGRW